MAAYLEAEQELARLARRAAGMRGGPRALILPGIMGSSIGRVRKDGSDDVTWFDPFEIAQGQITKLALPDGSRYGPLGVLRFAYERLRLVLRIAGFDAAFHPYDWRRDLDWNGEQLTARLVRERRQDVDPRRPQHGRPGCPRCARARRREPHQPRDPARHAESRRLRRGPGAARHLPAGAPRRDARPASRRRRNRGQGA